MLAIFSRAFEIIGSLHCLLDVSSGFLSIFGNHFLEQEGLEL
jgi:hypothetical protein